MTSIKDVEKLLPKQKMLDLMNSHDFKLKNSTPLIDLLYNSESHNPFKATFVAHLIFDQRIIVAIDAPPRSDYVIRIGVYSGWVGGMTINETLFSFFIPALTFDDFKTGFLRAVVEQEYCLVRKFHSGNIDKIVFKGSLSDIQSFALENGYEQVEVPDSPNGVPFYFINHSLDYRNHLTVCVIPHLAFVTK